MKATYLSHPPRASALLPNVLVHTAFRRTIHLLVFAKLDPNAFHHCFVRWVDAIRDKISLDVVAIDGKTSRRTRDSAIDLSLLHIVSAWSNAHRLVLGQVRVDEKSNEITAIPLLLDMLDIKGSLVTIDAMGCQTAIAEKIVERDADYVLACKGTSTFLARSKLLLATTPISLYGRH